MIMVYICTRTLTQRRLWGKVEGPLIQREEIMISFYGSQRKDRKPEQRVKHELWNNSPSLYNLPANNETMWRKKIDLPFSRKWETRYSGTILEWPWPRKIDLGDSEFPSRSSMKFYSFPEQRKSIINESLKYFGEYITEVVFSKMASL